MGGASGWQAGQGPRDGASAVYDGEGAGDATGDPGDQPRRPHVGLARPQRGEEGRLGVQRGRIGQLASGGDQGLHGSHHARVQAQDLGRQLPRRGQGPSLRRSAGGQAQPLQLRGTQLPSAEHQLHGPRRAQQPQQALAGAPAGDQAQLPVDQPEAHRLVHHPQVAGQGDLRPAAQGEAVDRGQGGDGQLLQAPQGLAHQARQALAVGSGQLGVQDGLVAAAAEGPLAGAGEDEEPRPAALRGLLVQGLHLPAEALHGLPVQGVEHPGTVEGEGDDALGVAVDQQGGGCG
jgi:hypothetical protein